MDAEAILNSVQSVSELQHIRSGKVRELFRFTENILVIVATDRISAFDVVLPTDIPSKGKALTNISKFWFRETKDVCPNHFVSTRPQDFIDLEDDVHEVLAGRTMMVEQMKPVLFECIVRGHLCGSAFREYEKGGSVGGVELPSGLNFGDKITPEPLFTLTTKAESGHDLPVGFDSLEAGIGKEDAELVRKMSQELYQFGQRAARQAGLVLADTKFEFGYNRRGEVCVMDEMLTPDSSRFWLRSDYFQGNRSDPYDKEFVRQYLIDSGWDRDPPPPELPEDIVSETARRYSVVHDAVTRLKL